MGRREKKGVKVRFQGSRTAHGRRPQSPLGRLRLASGDVWSKEAWVPTGCVRMQRLMQGFAQASQQAMCRRPANQCTGTFADQLARGRRVSDQSGRGWPQRVTPTLGEQGHGVAEARPEDSVRRVGVLLRAPCPLGKHPDGARKTRPVQRKLFEDQWKVESA